MTAEELMCGLAGFAHKDSSLTTALATTSFRSFLSFYRRQRGPFVRGHNPTVALPARHHAPRARSRCEHSSQQALGDNRSAWPASIALLNNACLRPRPATCQRHAKIQSDNHTELLPCGECHAKARLDKWSAAPKGAGMRVGRPSVGYLGKRYFRRGLRPMAEGASTCRD